MPVKYLHILLQIQGMSTHSIQPPKSLNTVSQINMAPPLLVALFPSICSSNCFSFLIIISSVWTGLSCFLRMVSFVWSQFLIPLPVPFILLFGLSFTQHNFLCHHTKTHTHTPSGNLEEHGGWGKWLSALNILWYLSLWCELFTDNN